MVVRLQHYLNLKPGLSEEEEGKKPMELFSHQIKEKYYLNLTSQENLPEFSHLGKQITQNLSTIYYFSCY